jgi:hypothetical protein
MFKKQDCNDQTRQEALLHLFSMFLLGSSKKRKLDLASDSDQLDVVLDVLKTNPSCFQQLEEIEVDFYDLNMLEKILEVSWDVRPF